MNLDELKQSGKIIFDVLAGSRMYNLSSPTSDFDYRGIFLPTMDELLSPNNTQEQVNNDKQDVVYYELKRFFTLAKTANPNIIELLFAPQECVRVQKPKMYILMAKRHVFITKKAYFTHVAYATAQIKKCKGTNKRVNNPQTKEPPTIEQFCWFIPNRVINTESMPMRPIALKDASINLGNFNCSCMEHLENTYRLYDYGLDAKGVFHGNQIVPQSIPMDDENKRFYGLLIYNENAYRKAHNEWKEYWIWMRERNPNRWIDQESGKRDYDCKNVMHCLRLMMSCENILRNGEPLVRFTGDMQKFLMSVRNGEIKYEDIMKMVDEKELLLKELYETSTIPHTLNDEDVAELYMEIVSSTWNKRLYKKFISRIL